jgi:hypothetical protein
MPSPLLLFLISLCIIVPFFFPSPASHPTASRCTEKAALPRVSAPEMPPWTLLPTSSARFRRLTLGCHLALNQGRRRYQEDRAVCELSLRIPFLSFSPDRGARCSCLVLDFPILWTALCMLNSALGWDGCKFLSSVITMDHGGVVLW